MASATTNLDKLSKQRIDYESLPGGGQRARMTITLAPNKKFPRGKTFTFVEDVTPHDVKKYTAEIAGVEIGCALAQSPISGVEVGNIFGDIAKFAGGAVKTVAKTAKAIVTSKVMQTAAKGLALASPLLGPFAPIGLAVAGGVGVAGKLLSSKTAKSVGAPLASNALAQSAMADAKALTSTPGGLSGLLKVAVGKANNALKLVNTTTANQIAKTTGTDVMAQARAGKIRSNQNGVVSEQQLLSAAAGGRLFFVAA